MFGHGHHSCGERRGGGRGVDALSGLGRLDRRNLSKKAKFVLRARNYIDVNNSKRPLSH